MSPQEYTSLIIFFALLATAAAVILVPAYWRAQERRRLLDLVATALDKGAPIPPEALNALPGARPRPNVRTRDRRWGVLLFSLGLGLIVVGSVLGLMAGLETESGMVVFSTLAGIGSIPAFLGGGFIALSLMNDMGQDF